MQARKRSQYTVSLLVDHHVSRFRDAHDVSMRNVLCEDFRISRIDELV